jgi:hypothetical protein
MSSLQNDTLDRFWESQRLDDQRQGAASCRRTCLNIVHSLFVSFYEDNMLPVLVRYLNFYVSTMQQPPPKVCTFFGFSKIGNQKLLARGLIGSNIDFFFFYKIRALGGHGICLLD